MKPDVKQLAKGRLAARRGNCCQFKSLDFSDDVILNDLWLKFSQNSEVSQISGHENFEVTNRLCDTCFLVNFGHRIRLLCPLGRLKLFSEVYSEGRVRIRSKGQISYFINVDNKMPIRCSLNSGTRWCLLFAVRRLENGAQICIWVIDTVFLFVYRRTKCRISQPFCIYQAEIFQSFRVIVFYNIPIFRFLPKTKQCWQNLKCTYLYVLKIWQFSPFSTFWKSEIAFR